MVVVVALVVAVLGGSSSSGRESGCGLVRSNIVNCFILHDYKILQYCNSIYMVIYDKIKIKFSNITLIIFSYFIISIP